jgi:hypothetical protein
VDSFAFKMGEEFLRVPASMASPAEDNATSKQSSAQLLISSIKAEVKKKHFSCGWNFSCFSAHSIELVLF